MNDQITKTKVLPEELLRVFKTRRTTRQFSSANVELEVIQNCIAIAGSAPSGANMQPWKFIVVKDADLKRKIRTNCEEVERQFYTKQSTKEWQKDVKQFETNASKPFLEEAPYLICVFAEKYRIDEEGNISKNYYVQESVGIAAGFLISALHLSGLSSVAYTPSPMNFLNELLNVDDNMRPFTILVTGYAKEGIEIPVRPKKSIDKIMQVI